MTFGFGFVQIILKLVEDLNPPPEILRCNLRAVGECRAVCSFCDRVSIVSVTMWESAHRMRLTSGVPYKVPRVYRITARDRN